MSDALTAAIEEIGEEVIERALVQYRSPDRPRAPFWGLMLRTQSGLHLIYSEEHNWFSRLMRREAPAHHRISIPNDTIKSIEVPEFGGRLRRLLKGITAVARIVQHDETVTEVEVDQSGAKLLDAALKNLAHE